MISLTGSRRVFDVAIDLDDWPEHQTTRLPNCGHRGICVHCGRFYFAYVRGREFADVVVQKKCICGKGDITWRNQMEFPVIASGAMADEQWEAWLQELRSAS